MQVAIVGSSRLLGKFPVTVPLQASLTILCVPGWAELHKTASGFPFCMGGAPPQNSQPMWPPGPVSLRNLGLLWPTVLARGREKTTFCPAHSILKTRPRYLCATESLTFRPTCVPVYHVSQLPSVFDTLLAITLQEGARISQPHTGVLAREGESGHHGSHRLLQAPPGYAMTSALCLPLGRGSAPHLQLHPWLPLAPPVSSRGSTLFRQWLLQSAT